MASSAARTATTARLATRPRATSSPAVTVRRTRPSTGGARVRSEAGSGEGPEPGHAHRRVGRPEHARGNLGRAEEARDVRDQRHPDPCALLRRRGPCRQGRGPGGTGESGYARGVPMGGTLPPSSGRPTFTVHAMKDPDGANLDRIQVIKGWVDAGGGHHEKIVDVAWSGGRKRGADGQLPGVGNTVDTKTAAYTNSIGSPELVGHWTDDEFDPRQYALYYARVIEIPTPRWSTFDAARAGLPLLDGFRPRSRSGRGRRRSGTRLRRNR